METTFIGAARVEAALKAAGPMVMDAFLNELEHQGSELATYIKTQELSGQILQNRTGTLRRSIHMTPFRSQGFVTVGTNVQYAKVHEFGMTISAKNAPYLKFKTDDGKWHSVKQVTIPARPFMRPALQNNTGVIRAALIAIVKRAVAQAAGVP